MIRAHYDEWSTSYDAEIGRNGYAIPARIATALAAVCDDLAAPMPDFGCAAYVIEKT